MLANYTSANRPAGIDFSAGVEPAELCKGELSAPIDPITGHTSIVL